ncbi:MAG: ABC transporter substrate-binding protein [Atopobiaceae bacterium]
MTKNVTRCDAIALFGGAAAFAALGTLAGCSGGGGKKYKIGVLQLTEHDALDQANEGFVQALDESGLSYTIDQQNAQNDQSACQTIAQKLVNGGDDLILAIATPAAQAVAGAATEIPIVGTAITDFAASGLVASNDAPTDNTIATGMSTVSMVANENKLPVICGEKGMVDNGGLATYGIDYNKLGHKTGQMAVKILNGESKPADMPIETLDASECTLATNEDTAKAVGVDLSVLNS